MSTPSSPTPFSAAVAAVRDGRPLDEAVDELLSQLTREERLWLLDGDLPFWPGMADMLTNGYNLTPSRWAGSSGWASPACCSPTARAAS
ncbi:hypothetical protein [Microbispora sp. CSR-4]|uniref:hypothetical protein n=1 Tax=Microbispora sp. CSR-4 TaxID=2592813 RepID=UPI001C9C2E8E|nr:hypothetical protein [Microbispora sp. CSR-4]